MAVEVLIVGAGPVGLNLAVCLSNLGIKCRIIEKRSSPNTTANAILVNARTLEIWQTLGFDDLALERGINLNALSYYDAGKFLNITSFANLDSEYKFILALPQAQTEQLLIEQLSKFGIEIEWNTTLTDLVDEANQVRATCSKSAIIENITASFVVGCDGYNSSVRNIVKIERDCHDLTQHFLTVEAQLNGHIAHDEMTSCLHADGVVVFTPTKNNMRIILEISSDPVFKNLKIGNETVFNDILSRRFPGVSIKKMERTTSFYVHECLVRNYYRNRVILCGDAAHTHSVAGGQGMNTGIQDTWNLAWKLKHILRGEASFSLLDTYHAERHQVGHNVLKRSGAITALATTTNKFFQFVRNFGLGHFIDLDMIANKHLNSMSQTDICYSQSSLIKTKQVLRQGKLRYQLTSMTWLLLSSNSLKDAMLPGFIKLEEYSSSKLVKKLPLCLIRPDGYIALYANTLDEVKKFLVLNRFLVN